MKIRLRYIIFTLCLCLCLFSGWKIYSIYAEYWQGEKSYEELTNQYVSAITQEERPAVPNNTGSLEPNSTDSAPMVTELPTEPVEAAPITVDFNALLETCPDVVGWLYCPDTPINYPVVQAGDNEYYLRRLLDGTWNSSGSIFLDYRCTSDFSGWNNIIYGHNMKNDSMFGTLEEYKKQEYYDAHPIWYLLTPGQNYKIELLGGYTTSGDATNTNGFPQTQTERDELIATARQNSTFQSAATVTDEERIITLSTCAYDFDGARYVLVGVLQELPKEITRIGDA